ncbi:MAG TPA: MarR family winged helix-turn-helix transcriptional regulator [Acidimicrobiales bacterium]
MGPSATSRRPAPLAHTAAGLLAVLVPFRHAMRRAVRKDFPLAPLPSAQIELLRVVERTPGVGVRQAADELSLAANSVSTLVNKLVVGGLLDRGQDPTDRRNARLSLTAKAVGPLDLWQDYRHDVMVRALSTLSPPDRRRIDEALPALGRVIDALEVL